MMADTARSYGFRPKIIISRPVPNERTLGTTDHIYIVVDIVGCPVSTEEADRDVHLSVRKLDLIPSPLCLINA